MPYISARDEDWEVSRDASGELRWGKKAAGFMIFRGDGRVLLTLRSQEVDSPGIWSIPGGRIEDAEDAPYAALNEAVEELGSLPPIKIVDQHLYRSGQFQYLTLIAKMSERQARGWKPRLNWENDDWGWFSTSKLPEPIHPNVVSAVNYALGGRGLSGAADQAVAWHTDIVVDGQGFNLAIHRPEGNLWQLRMMPDTPGESATKAGRRFWKALTADTWESVGLAKRHIERAIELTNARWNGWHKEVLEGSY